MRPVIRYQSQLLYRKSYKPNRIIKIKPPIKTMTFRPRRPSQKPLGPMDQMPSVAQ